MSEHPKLQAFNLNQWLDTNRERLVPPVNNQLLHDDSTGMIVMVIGGPNTRVDFHDDPVDEWFYQIKGDMMLKIADGGEIYDVPSLYWLTSWGLSASCLGRIIPSPLANRKSASR